MQSLRSIERWIRNSDSGKYKANKQCALEKVLITIIKLDRKNTISKNVLILTIKTDRQLGGKTIDAHQEMPILINH